MPGHYISIYTDFEYHNNIILCARSNLGFNPPRVYRYLSRSLRDRVCIGMCLRVKPVPDYALRPRRVVRENRRIIVNHSARNNY